MIAPAANAFDVAGSDSNRRASRTVATAAPCVIRQRCRSHAAVENAPIGLPCVAAVQGRAPARSRWNSSALDQHRQPRQVERGFRRGDLVDRGFEIVQRIEHTFVFYEREAITAKG